MSEKKPTVTTTMKIRIAIASSLVLVIVVALALAVGLGGADTPSSSATSASGQQEQSAQTSSLRTLVLQRGGNPAPSDPGSTLHGSIKRGALPANPVIATVLTDENCEPDAEGVSHCTNRIEMPNGTRLVVTHPHRMSEVPCLAPGEKVKVIGKA